ncbi:MAG: hypothetical protein A2Y15_03560 [Clostridiales bacterium GWF2_36_10]|nr:MAG: hypothetical protein A2Y15_03560 [Clostridiales bacterium GWF2_36_10]
MSESTRKKINTPTDNLILLPREVEKMLKNAGAAELKVLLHLFARGDYTPGETSRELGLNVSEVEAAVAFWRGAGIIELSNTKETKKNSSSVNLFQTYDAEILSAAVEKDNDFKNVCDMVGDLLGRLLNKNDYNSLYYLYDYTRMPADFICGITEYCAQEKKLSMQYIMKTALGLCDDGIDTYEKLEQHLARKEKSKTDIAKLRKLCGMGERELSPKESECVNRWFFTWDMPFELIKTAYEKTVDATGRVQFPYMNTILKSWYESGFKTVEDVKIGDKKESVESSFDADEFFEVALQHSKNRMKE